mmetsp:Transcript_11402/g.21776  ORF Transcript_11402/g.21776 Transcript_11402/m.21776 type:complete len:141 (+) Transcript_11402:656-1078(+)|eukprot:scaffold4442_cov125-Amphora_coffeaeformis.AAC.38
MPLDHDNTDEEYMYDALQSVNQMNKSVLADLSKYGIISETEYETRLDKASGDGNDEFAYVDDGQRWFSCRLVARSSYTTGTFLPTSFVHCGSSTFFSMTGSTLVHGRKGCFREVPSHTFHVKYACKFFDYRFGYGAVAKG